MKRSGKFYRRNEEKVMLSLGLKPTKNSGSGWVEKEDGQSDKIICQLKSTDKESMRLNKYDIDTLNYNAAVSHKLPVFAIQFLSSNETYLLVKPEQLCDVAKYIQTGEVETENEFIGLDLSDYEESYATPKVRVKSSSKARESYNREREEKYKKKGKSAR